MTRRAAVVIGVDRTGGLSPLESAALGAAEVAAWLREERFDVECVTDQEDLVTGERVKAALRKFVTAPPRYHLLLVYFSGHGYWHARTDIWLLSGAPEAPDEAVNLDGAMELARYSGIANVIFVSDACRSIPDARTGAFVRGIDAFPNFLDVAQISKVDYFKATSDATQAYEAPIAGRKKSVLTHALMSAYDEASPDMVLELSERGETIKVVPNRRLERYLQAKVNATLAAIDGNLTQRIDVNVPSADEVYIARLRPPSPFESARSAFWDIDKRSAPVNEEQAIARDAAAALQRLFNHAGGDKDLDKLLRVEHAATEKRIGHYLPRGESEAFESGCGFVLRGAQVATALCSLRNGTASAELLDVGGPGSEPAIIHVRDAGAGAMVYIQTAQGRAMLLPAIAGLIGHGLIDESGLQHVSYIPFDVHERDSVLSWPRIEPRDRQAQRRWEAYLEQRPAIDRLRALAAIATAGDTLRLVAPADAKALTQRIMIGDTPDPALGLYAAHASAQASLNEPLAALAASMRAHLKVHLFDFYALARRPGEPPPSQILPPCPLLTRTWNVLRPRGIELPASLARARAYLTDSLWSSFEAQGAQIISQAVLRGEI